MTRLRVRRAVLGEIARSARVEYPREAVGLLAGPAPHHFTRVFPLTNIATDDREFLADPFEQWEALNRIREEGLVVCAAYHSHPDGGVGLSEADVRFANATHLIQVIVSISADLTRFAAYAVVEHVPVPLMYDAVDD